MSLMKDYKSIKVKATRTIDITINVNVPADFDENSNLMDAVIKNKIYNGEYIINSENVDVNYDKMVIN